ncbi:hypothetical protein MTR_2g029050 [Medicago truncatula]|uniref:Uncharacterized protein n=1 Tax=Medicago truncatula TaxID=3880 RepID=G7IJS1_MEDTR|nr:hypothetical protein MTR_2g029050 [Medicago truncatula]
MRTGQALFLLGIKPGIPRHFPNEVSRKILKEKRKTITLIDDQTLELSKRVGPYGPARLARLIIGLGP